MIDAYLQRLADKAARSIDKPRTLAVMDAIMGAPRFQFNMRAGGARTLGQPDFYLNRPRRVCGFSGGMQGGLEIVMGLTPRVEMPWRVKITTR